MRPEMEQNEKNEHYDSQYYRVKKYQEEQNRLSERVKEFIKVQQKNRETQREIGPDPTHPPVIATMSSKGGSGKTTFALMLSLQMASLGKRTLLVDYDFFTHGLSHYLMGMRDLKLYDEDPVTVEDVMDEIDKGRDNIGGYLKNNANKIYIRITNSPKTIRLTDNLYVVLGRTKEKIKDTLEDLQSQIRPYLLGDSILEYIIKGTVYSPGNFDYIILDLGAGAYAYTVMHHITHPVFVTESNRVSMVGIEKLRASWTNNFVSKQNSEANGYKGIKESAPYILFTRITPNSHKLLTNEIEGQVRNNFFILPPLPHSSFLQGANNTNNLFNLIYAASPYTLQVLECISILMPGLLESTDLEKVCRSVKQLFEDQFARKENPKNGDNPKEDLITTYAVRDYYKHYKEKGKIPSILNEISEEDFQNQQNIWMEDITTKEKPAEKKEPKNVKPNAGKKDMMEDITTKEKPAEKKEQKNVKPNAGKKDIKSIKSVKPAKQPGNSNPTKKEY